MYNHMAIKHFLLCSFLFLSLNLYLTASKSTTLSLELIHRDSIEYPSSQTNLNFDDKLERLIRISKARASYLTSKERHITTRGSYLMHPEVVPDGFLYLVQVHIGNPSMPFYLMLDTGSELTWLQCQPCQSCFRQNYSIYDPATSTTYKKVPCQTPICNSPVFVCTNDECLYQYGYYSKQSTKGILSWETFQFLGDQTFTINDVPFGCSHENQGFNFPSGLLAGIMGLNKRSMSFVSHLGSFIGNRFSYCLGDMLMGTKSNLKFGDDIGFIGGAVQTTPFVDIPNYSGAYGVNLIDISINGTPMNFPQDTFKFKDNENGAGGGFIIDSGTALTFLAKNVYWKLHQRFEEYFFNLKLELKSDCPVPQGLLCFKLPDNFNAYPSMTYHFQGADLYVLPRYLFLESRQQKFFALMILPNDVDGLSIMGAWNQQNTRFIFDLGSNKLSFVHEICAMD